MKAKKRRYDYVKQSAKCFTYDAGDFERGGRAALRCVLRKLVREAAIAGLREWSGTTGKPTVVERALAKRVARGLVS